MAKYAEKTEVSSSRSRDEIERTLTRYGATQFAYAWQEGRAVIGFVLGGKQVRLMLPLPDRGAREFVYTPERGLKRSPEQQAQAYEQAVRQKWRALALVVKAKLEAVEAGISVFEREFFYDIVLPDGRTVGEYVLPQVEESYRSGIMPPMIPALGEGVPTL
ncbi:MAG: hypothetical protein DBX59_01720 [Bacillota bacterium]|nr:MAG: hypothetical protein DBX59_01720 [Bacillota bacterium]